MVGVKRVKYRVTEGDLNLGGECTMQFTCDMLLNFTLEIQMILLTNVTELSLIKNDYLIHNLIY